MLRGIPKAFLSTISLYPKAKGEKREKLERIYGKRRLALFCPLLFVWETRRRRRRRHPFKEKKGHHSIPLPSDFDKKNLAKYFLIHIPHLPLN